MEGDGKLMGAKAYLIKNITQKNNHTFTIEWSDSVVQDFRLSDLQKRCECAGCVDEMTGQRLVDAKAVKEDVKASKIVSVGHYAIRIYFTSGCSNGIYRFDSLRAMT